MSIRLLLQLLLFQLHSSQFDSIEEHLRMVILILGLKFILGLKGMVISITIYSRSHLRLTDRMQKEFVAHVIPYQR